MMDRVDARPYDFPLDGEAGDGGTALVVLGMQAGQLAALGPAATAARDRAAALIAFLAPRLPVLIGQRGVRDLADLPPVVRARSERRRDDRILPFDDPAAALALPVDRGTVFRHRADNAFLASDLGHLLAVAGARRLILCGLRTEGSVHATMREAGDRGFDCLLISDASAGSTPAMHETILSLTAFGGGLFGAVADSAALLAGAGARA